MITQRYELIEEHRSGHTFYHLQDNYGKFSIDKDIYHCVYLLNQQDARIKVLEEENQQLKEQLKDKSNTIQNLLELQTIMESSCGYQMFLDCQDEIEQLKQSQNQKAIELLEKVKNYFVVEEIDEDGIATGDWTIIHDSCSVAEYIDSQIKDLKGSKNNGRIYKK